MHELGIVFYAIDMVEDLGRENHLSSVSSVTMSIGEVSGVIPSYLADCWRWAADRSDLLRGAELRIETIDAVTVFGLPVGTMGVKKKNPNRLGAPKSMAAMP